MKQILTYVSVAALLVGCAPTLQEVTRTTQGFAVQQRCAQGPFEIHVPAFGSRWGEDVTLEALGNAIDGHSSITIDGSGARERTFSNGSVNTSACVLSDADRAAVVTGGAPVTMPSTGTGTSTGTSTSTSTSTSTVSLVQAGIPSEWIYRTEIAKYHAEVTDWSLAQNALKRGQDIKIVFWSEHPLDLQSTTFVLTHSEMVPPNGDDKKWQAHLDEMKSDAEKRQREAEEESKKAQLEAEAHAKKEAEEARVKSLEAERCREIRGADKKCHDAGFKTGSELIAYAELQRKCEELARNNATDQACRDDGWRNDNERPDYHSSSTVAVQTQTQTQTQTPVLTEPPKPQGHAADRPPPAPQAETQSPKPSEHAEWIPGSWQWSGFDWVWLGGGWRVPEQDRAQKLTATAPSAPPVARVEVRPPQPIASAVWADGYWHYASGQWIWVPGHWAVPPRAGATWRPSTYRSDGVQLRLDPGGWIVH